MTAAATAHGQFTITRDYAAAPARVFAAWADIETKARWFIGPDDWTLLERRLDLRVGGEELLHGRFPGSGRETHFSARYHLVERNARLVYVYDMATRLASRPALDGPAPVRSGAAARSPAGDDWRHHSVSLATVEFLPRGGGTTLRFTEQVVFVDGTASREGTPSRERGTAAHLDRLGAVIDGATTR